MTKKMVITILALAMAIGIAAIPAGAEGNSKFLMASGQIWQGPYLSPPEVKCEGGTLDPNTGLCSPETKRTLIRNGTSLWNATNVIGTAASLFQGPFRPVVNCNLDENLQGECWGNFELDGIEGGQWKGTWSGKFDLVRYISVVSIVGHGEGGSIDGLQMKMDAMSPCTLPYLTFLAQVVNR